MTAEEKRQIWRDGNDEFYFGGYGIPQPGNFYVSRYGYVKQHRYPQAMSVIRGLLVPVQKEHIFGEVVFKETGEFRKARFGEWYLGDVHGRVFPIFKVEPKLTNSPFKILEFARKVGG